jgi:hypothetical protein
MGRRASSPPAVGLWRVMLTYSGAKGTNIRTMTGHCRHGEVSPLNELASSLITCDA